MAMVVRANKTPTSAAISPPFASAAALYDVGFSHFWHAPSDNHGGDLIFFQATRCRGSTPAPSCSAELTQEQMDNFRQETDGKGISSYPHPWLMPDFWQFPTVSMGLGLIQAIYQARFMKYLASADWLKAGEGANAARSGPSWRRQRPTKSNRSAPSAWLAARSLDNLIFVINCNLQRLDGPVRGNGKIIQELEAEFRGAGWNVIKADLGHALGSPLCP